jgi:hypothetical protein
MRKTVYTILLLALSIGTSYAEAPRAVDATEFDIAGVRLGMSQAEAIQAISSTLGINQDEVVLDKFPRENLITGKKDPTYFKVAHGIGKFVVHLEPNALNPSVSPTVVNLIKYEMPWTQENVQSMKEAAIKKYGQPSNGIISGNYEWCIEPSANPGIGCGFFNGPVLKYFGTSLELSDPKYRQAVIEFRNKQNSANPSF